MTVEKWNDGASDLCSSFQQDLSCMVDAELSEAPAARVMVHLESCDCCRKFFEDTRLQVRLHRDIADPDRLFARFAMLTGSEMADLAHAHDLTHRLATVFYQLGKAYVLVAVDPGYRERVFESAVAVQPAQTQGRGFVDGVLLSGKDASTGVDWQHARSMLNGRLERIESPLEKGRRLLEEALHADPAHEEAQLYLAFLHSHEGKRVTAAEEYRRIFDTAVNEVNRGHAAIQIGRLHSVEKNYRKAIASWRWITISGLADIDDRFFVARFNIGMVYALMRNQRRSLHYFRELLSRHPSRVAEVAQLFARSPHLREAIDSQKGFVEALVQTCPELFARAGTQGTGDAHEQGIDQKGTGPNGIEPNGMSPNAM